MPKHAKDEYNSGPAYKQLWFWLILSPLLTTFVVGFTMLGLAINTNDGAALGTYQKSGFDTTRSFAREQQAERLAMVASVQIVGDSIIVKLSGPQQKPKQLQLDLLFPTSKTKDVNILLDFKDGQYSAPAPNIEPVKRIIQLQEIGESNWLLQNQAYWPISSPIVLTPYLDANR